MPPCKKSDEKCHEVPVDMLRVFSKRGWNSVPLVSNSCGELGSTTAVFFLFGTIARDCITNQLFGCGSEAWERKIWGCRVSQVPPPRGLDLSCIEGPSISFEKCVILGNGDFKSNSVVYIAPPPRAPHVGISRTHSPAISTCLKLINKP